jgi:hypothetical protein
MNIYVIAAAAFTAALSLAGIAAAEPAAPADGPKLICKGGQKVIGSRMRTPRRCRTEEEWRVDEEKASRLPETLRVGAAKDEGAPRPQR